MASTAPLSRTLSTNSRTDLLSGSSRLVFGKLLKMVVDVVEQLLEHFMDSSLFGFQIAACELSRPDCPGGRGLSTGQPIREIALLLIPGFRRG